MARMLKDEMAVTKGIMIDLGNDNILFVVQRYHTERNEDTGKVDRSKSLYSWVARVTTRQEILDKISWCMDDKNRLNRFKFKNDPYPYYLAVGNSSDNAAFANFLTNKLKKMDSWEDGMKRLNGWETQTANRQAGYNANAKWMVKGYKADNGDMVDLDDHESVLKCIGQNLFADQVMKSKLPPNGKLD